MENMICETEKMFNSRLRLLIFSLLTFSLFLPETVNSDIIEPKITNISASSSDGTLRGPTTGGTLITIEGSGFLSYSQVYIIIDKEMVRVNPLDVKIYDNEGKIITEGEIGTRIDFYTPKVKKAGLAEIYILNPGYFRGSRRYQWFFEYLYLPPVIDSISPIGGKLKDGGTQIEIIGSELRDGAKVRIGEKEVRGEVKDEGKKITAKTPPGSESGPQDITVINPDGKESNTLENSFVYAKSPKITDIDPKGGSIGGGTQITITGIDFLSGVEARIGERVRVLIGERKADVVETYDRKIVVKSPFGEIGAQDVIVQNILNPNELFDIRKDGFVYADPPEIERIPTLSTGVNPNGGTKVDIIGKYFPAQENLQVLIGGKEATEVSVDNVGTKITAKAPSGSGEVDVKVSNLINPGELSHTLPAAFTYNPLLEALEIEPDSGILDGGTLITITGVGFIEPISIKIGGRDARIVRVSSKQITAKTPKSERDGTVNVSIINEDEQRDSSLKFTYNPPNPIPIIISINPEEGKLEGGDEITIIGENFMDKPTVEIGGNRAEDVKFISSNEIKATTPRVEKEGTYDVIVTNPDGQPTKKPGKYTYNPQPKITNISPEIGSPSGGTKITISGENFKDVKSVDIGGRTVEDFEQKGSSTIEAVTPPGDVGKAMDIVVINRDSQEAKLVGRFTPVRLVVSKIEPESGSEVGGKQITISGDGFIEGAIVTIGDKPAEYIKVESRRRITAKTPQNPPGLKDVIVINPNEQEPTPEDGKGEGKFTYYAGFPSDTNIRVYNYPNPINVGQSTTFRYNPKKDTGSVEIKIFNMAGELITSLSDGDRDGFIPCDIDIPPGLYPYVLILNGKIEQGQLLLVKRTK